MSFKEEEDAIVFVEATGLQDRQNTAKILRRVQGPRRQSPIDYRKKRGDRTLFSWPSQKFGPIRYDCAGKAENVGLQMLSPGAGGESGTLYHAPASRKKPNKYGSFGDRQKTPCTTGVYHF
jgi:hypothetical protein